MRREGFAAFFEPRILQKPHCLQPIEVEAVKQAAKLKGMDYADLIREWVLERIRTA